MGARGLRVLELYAGLGGVAAALGSLSGRFEGGGGHEIVAAVDQSPVALDAYRHNFPGHPVIESRVGPVGAERLAALDADLWWASPPCQPFTRRGKRRDLDDPRAETFRALVDLVAAVRPPYFAMESVEGFRDSRARDLLHRTLDAAGYGSVQETVLCPSEMGRPNRRPRYYLVAGRVDLARENLVEPGYEPPPAPRLPQLVDEDPDPSLRLEDEVLQRYRHALHVVDADDPDAVTTCFTAAYGRSPVRSGSYLRQGGVVRRFSPREILRLLGFPASYEMPPGLPRRKAWHLAGNSLSLEPVRRVLSALPGLSTLA